MEDICRLHIFKAGERLAALVQESMGDESRYLLCAQRKYCVLKIR